MRAIAPPAGPEPAADTPTGGGFGHTGPTAHVPADASDAPPGEAQLDDALRETFPASDPISPGAAAAEQRAEPLPDTAAAPQAARGQPFPFPTRDSMAAPQTAADDDIRSIFDELRRGRGRERVNDGNVQALIALAHERGDAQLELLLREWQSPCGEDAGSLPESLPPP